MFKKMIAGASRLLGRGPDAFLNDVKGLIHVGANTGQERDLYRQYGLCVAWVEPIPEVYAVLGANIRDYKDQTAHGYLVTDKDGETYTFHIANNGGASSSILDFKEHKEVWPEVTYERSVELTSVTLPTLMEREGLSPENYDALVLDTQGSELLVLRGAIPLLPGFRYVKTEVPDFESYKGCCLLADLEAFMRDQGFALHRKTPFAQSPEGGRYYDVVFIRAGASAN